MRIIVVLLGWFLSVGAAGASPASYRFQALIDIDRNAATGCAAAGAAALPGGMEFRVVAHADRTRVNTTTLESCQTGVWRIDQRDDMPLPIAVGAGQFGSDVVRWSAPRPWLAAYPRIPVRLLAERLDVPAVDALARGTQWLALDLAQVDDTRAVPAAGFGGMLVLGAALAWFGRRRIVDHRRRSWGWLALVLGLCVFGWWQPRALADGPLFDRVVADDAGNDVADGGADILHAEVSADAERLHFRIDVNDIEASGLGNTARVLFIGNSLTYSNDLPTLLEAIALQAGKQLDADAITIPGGALEDHFRGRTAHAALASGGYQIVILQQGPSSLPSSQANLREWTQRFESRIRAGGARPALYMVWPDASRLDFFDDVRGSYSNAALDVDGMFIPAGEAWRAAWRSDPGLPLYDGDLFHPSPLGSYAAALSIFAELYGQSPVGLPARLDLGHGQALEFDVGHAQIVQTAAWTAHLQYGRPGG